MASETAEWKSFFSRLAEPGTDVPTVGIRCAEWAGCCLLFLDYAWLLSGSGEQASPVGEHLRLDAPLEGVTVEGTGVQGVGVPESRACREALRWALCTLLGDPLQARGGSG